MRVSLQRVTFHVAVGTSNVNKRPEPRRPPSRGMSDTILASRRRRGGEATLAHELFISYSNKSKPLAGATRAALEASSMRRGIAPRHALHGNDWGEAIVDVLNSTRVGTPAYSVNPMVVIEPAADSRFA